jgi:hypothetical protein
MKNVLVYIIACFPFAAISQVKFGLTGGINLSSMEFKESNVETKRISRLNLGTIIEIPIDDNWFVLTGPLYSGKGVKYGRRFTTNTIDSSVIHLNYIELPLKLAYKFSEENANHFIIAMGLYLDYGFNGKQTTIGLPIIKYLHRKKTDQFKRLDFGLDISSMYELNNKWGFIFDYSRSFFNVHRVSKRKNNLFGVSLFWYLQKKSTEEE